MNEELNLGNVEIPLSEGKVWAKKYRDSPVGAEEGKDKIDAYLIPLETLRAVLKQKNIGAVRAYKGINKAGEQTLMFVGARLNKDTLIFEDVFSDGSSEECANAPVVYDTSRPCPPYGDPESPMNNG